MASMVDKAAYPSFSFTFESAAGVPLTVYRPDEAAVEKTKAVAKAIFIEAFSTTYTDYHRKSFSQDPIEKWLRLRDGLSLQEWLGLTFDGEYQEYQSGLKGIIYLVNPQNELIGWLSHSQVSDKGELYLSQCSLEGSSRGKKIASKAFATALQTQIRVMFPGAAEIKLIARKINEIAHRLYTGAGFIRDEAIDPAVYGESYDDRYVGYRLKIC